jgi:hypothetical protein
MRNRKVSGISKPMNFELRTGAYMDARLNVCEWGVHLILMVRLFVVRVRKKV